MVCVDCNGNTAVVNSRISKGNNSIWRRRKCLACSRLFTTREEPKYGEVWLIKDALGKLQPFSRDNLYLSIYSSLSHRKDAIVSAGALTEVVLKRLIGLSSNSVINTKDIEQITQVTLNRFDKVASVKYSVS